MGQTKIEWTDYSFNPWHGCQKVSDGCRFCYAETLDNRWNGGHWGPGSDRRAMSDDYWKQPIKWNAAAKKAGVKAKVFCASMADVFEGHADTLVHLDRLFKLILDTPYLIWQLLTKRPENVLNLIPLSWRGDSDHAPDWPHNVWIGTSVENQKAADERIPHLLSIPAPVRFLSCEPLLGPVDLQYPKSIWPDGPKGCCSGRDCGCIGLPIDPPLIYGIGWVIAGGESGPHARPMHRDWVRSLRDQCKSGGVPFFFKQWGEWVCMRQEPRFIAGKNIIKVKNLMPDGTEYITGVINPGDLACMLKVGKHAAGRLLDGIEHNEFPNL